MGDEGGRLAGCGAAIDRDRLLHEFTTLVSFDSPSLGERQLGNYVTARLRELGFTVTEDGAGAKLGGSCGNLHAVLPGTLPGEPLLFCAHLDTVEPALGKHAVVGGDGVIRSAGTTVLGADDAAAIAAILEALRAVLGCSAPRRSLELLITVAEELVCLGSAAADYSRIHAREAYVLDLDGPVGTAALQAPSIASFCVVVHGKSAHAGFAPELGVHAVRCAARAIAGLRLGHVDENTTVNIGAIHGGTSENIVPGRCEVRGEIRGYDEDEVEARLEHIRRVFSDTAGEMGATIDFTAHFGIRAYRVSPEHPVVRRFERACARRDIKPALTSTFGGSDNNHLAAHGIVGIVLATAMNNVHSTEEYTSIDELTRIAALTAELMCDAE